MKYKLIRKLKSLLSSLNSIHESAQLDSTTTVLGSKIGCNSKIGSNTKISNSIIQGKLISIGSSNYIKDSFINQEFSSEENCKIFGSHLDGNIKIGRFSSLWGPNLDIITGKQNVIIGNFCSIARNVSFQTFNHNHKKLTTYFIGQNFFNENWENERVSKGDIIIENDVWIGSHCVVLGGITIGNGAVVAANSVVAENVPAYSIVAGSPAKVISYRFDETSIQELLELQWWNWPISKILENKHLFESEWNSNLKKN